MTTYRLMDGLSGRPGVGSSGTQPPANTNAYSGPFVGGMGFKVTQGGMWLQGYWFWVPTNQQTGAQKFALWNPQSNTVGTVIPGSVVTSGTLTAGAMNFVALPTPIQLAIGAPYMATTGYQSTTGISYSPSQFATGQPYQNGITNGPLVAFSDGGPSNVWPVGNIPQGADNTTSNDPSVTMPVNAVTSANLWVDVQVTDQAPAGYTGSYRLWPTNPFPQSQVNDTANNFTLATEFSLSKSCTLNKIWFFSGPSSATQLPTEVGIWQIAGQTLVPGTHVVSPTWSGAAGSGWVSTTIPGNVVLQPGIKYKTSVFNGAASPSIWNVSFITYWNVGAGLNGITTGPLSAPNLANATNANQSTYNQGASFAYPATYDNVGTGDNYWVDVEVTPVASGGLLLGMFP